MGVGRGVLTWMTVPCLAFWALAVPCCTTGSAVRCVVTLSGADADCRLHLTALGGDEA